MADTVSLLALRTRAKQAADMENDSLVEDVEWDSYINYGARRLHDLLASAFGEEYFLKSETILVENGVNTYDLPADFYRARGVDVSVGSTAITCRRFQFRERNRYQWNSIGWNSIGEPPLYMIQGTEVRFMPTPNTGASVTLWYIPTLQVQVHGAGNWTSASLVNDDDLIDGVNGFEELVVLTAAIKAKMKNDEDPSALMAQFREVLEWVQTASKQRDAGEPTFIGSVQGDNGPFLDWFR